VNVTVFLGSQSGASGQYTAAAQAFGREIAASGHCLIYGGGSIGLMGVIADSVLRNGGKVVGVIPVALATREIVRPDLTELHVVGSMHERKALMADLSDGFVALPGGLGTLEELFEIWTWSQLGYHKKRCAILNVEGFFDGLIGFIDHAMTQGFLTASDRNIVRIFDDGVDLLEWVTAKKDEDTAYPAVDSSIL
jgi:uncharacterized protein (TIGR00730 family)